MVHRKHFECIDRILKSLCNDRRPFGNKIIVASGDFRQLTPITKFGGVGTTVAQSLAAAKDASIAGHPLFQQFRRLKIESSIRFKTQRWADFVLKVGRGEFPAAVDGLLNVSCPNWVKLTTDHNDACRVTGVSYDPVTGSDLTLRGAERLAYQYMSPYHQGVRLFNHDQLCRYPNRQKLTAYYTHSLNKNLMFQEVSNRFEGTIRSNVPDHELELAPGVPVMMMRNLRPSAGIANGTLMMVEKIERHCIRCRVIGTGKECIVPRIAFRLKVGGLECIRHQFPLALAFGITVNKSQGKTLDKYVIDLTHGRCFQHGQLYVALSRARCEDDVVVLLPHNPDGSMAQLQSVFLEELASLLDSVAP